jgi:LmbE family N-acetylglucosaminyl deacetylase
VLLEQMAALPFADLNEITRGTTALVLAPHADDESLGCGGLIAEAAARGLPPAVAVLTDGSMSHPSSRSHPPPRLQALRRAEARAAVIALGVGSERLHFLDLPDGGAPREGPGMEEAAARVADLARAYKVGTIFTTWECDPHADHVAAHVIARRAARIAGARVVSYPVWGWALPRRARLPVASVAGARLDIARHLPAKRRAIAAHESQHSGLIADDPQGFRLPASLLSAVDRPFEVFLFER